MARGAKKENALTPEEKLAQALVPEVERPYRVPENWRWVRLGSLASVKGGKRVPKGQHLSEKNTKHPYIRVTDFDNYGVDFSEIKYVDDAAFAAIKNYTISVKDIYISIAGSIGKIGIIPDFLDGANLTENAAKITDINGIGQKCLLWYLASEFAQDQMKESTISTTQPKLALFRIENILTPLPPLPEQQRIVDRIESLFAKLDEAKEKAQAVVDGFENRKAAILHKAFTGELTAEWRIGKQITLDSWHAKRLSETSITIIDGDRGKKYPKKEEFSPDGYCIFLNAKNVTKRGFVFDEVECITKEKDELLHNGRLKRGDMVMTTRGTIGNVAVYDDSVPYEHLRINSGMVIYRGGIEFIKQYLIWLYQSKLITTQIDNLRTGTAQPQLPIKVMNALVLPIPTIEEQKEIVETLNKLITKEQQAKAVAEQVISQIDTMKKAILARAFRGELGTNDPTEESAEGLLLDLN